MAYEPFEWRDGVEGGTLVTAARLNHLETQYDRAMEDVPRQFNVREFGAKGDGVTDDTAAIKAAITAASALTVGTTIIGRVVYFPAGRYLISDNLYQPRTVSLVGEGARNSWIVAPANTEFRIVYGSPIGTNGSNVARIDNLFLQRVSILAGETENDMPAGLTIRDVEIRECTNGIAFRYWCYNMRVDNVRVTACDIGIYVDGSMDGTERRGFSGVISKSAIADCEIGFAQNGRALDGGNVVFDGETNIEHNNVGVRLRSVGTTQLFFTNMHFEAMYESVFDADSGAVYIDGVWMYQLRGNPGDVPIALFNLSGSADVNVGSGRIQWTNDSRLALITATASLFIDTERVLVPQFWSTIVGTTSGTALASGTNKGVRIRTGVLLDSAVSSSTALAVGTQATIATITGLLGNRQQLEFELNKASGAGQFKVWVLPTVANNGVTFTWPTTATAASVRIIIAGNNYGILVRFDTGTYVKATLTPPHSTLQTKTIAVEAITIAASATERVLRTL